jgi:hypothetical protein
MSKRSRKAGVVYQSVGAGESRPRRPWLNPDWQPAAAPSPPVGVVKFSPDYSGDLPLWGLDWQNPGLSRELLMRLVEWQDTFDRHFDAFSGWDSDDVKSQWASEAEGLAEEVRRELGPGVSVEVSLWPLDAEDESGPS